MFFLFSRSSVHIWCLEIHKHNMPSQAKSKLMEECKRSERQTGRSILSEQHGRTSPGLSNGNVSSSISVVSANTSVAPPTPAPGLHVPPAVHHPHPHPSICLSESSPPRPRPPSAFKPPFRSLPASAAVQRWDVPTCMWWQGGSWEESCMQGGGGGERGWRCVFLLHPYSPVFVRWCSALAQQRNFNEEIVQMSFRIDSVLDVGRLWLDAKLRLEHIFLVRYFKCSASCLFCFRLGLSRLWDVFNMTAGSLLEEHSNVQNYPWISKWWCNHSKSRMTV